MVARRASFIIVLLSVILCGCANPLEKSVIETLTSKELDRVVRKDKTFLTTYSLVEGKWSNIITKEDSTRWQPLTYGRLHNYLTKVNSPEFNIPINAQLRERWEEKFNIDNIKVDSILAYWKNYMQQNSPDSLATAQFDGVEIEKVRNLNGEIDTLVKIRVKVKALKERIDSIFLSYNICDMLLDSTVSQAASSEILIKHKRRIFDSLVIKMYPQIDNPQTKRRLIYKDSSLYFQPIVTSVYIGKRCYNMDTIETHLPSAVSAILGAANDGLTPDFDLNYYRESIIREQLDSDYISQAAYIRLNAEGYHRQIDTLANSFTKL